MANVFDRFDTSPPSGNVFDRFDPAADPQEARRAELEAQVRREMQMSPTEWEAHIRAEVKAGKPYRQQPGSFGLFSNQVFDPFGVRDEMIGAGAYLANLVSSGFDTEKAAQAYTDAADITRAEQRVARDEYGIVPELIGGIGTTALPRAAAAAAAPSWTQGALQSAKAGAGFGGAAGAGHSEGGVGARVLGAGEGAAYGAAIGPALSHVAAPAIARTYGGLKEAARYGNRAVRSWSDPDQIAVETLADRMVGAGVGPAAARARISPDPSHQLQGRVNPQTGQPYSAADMADIISRSASGESHAAIAADYGLNPRTVGNYVRTYRENNPTPLNLMDIAQEVAGAGGAGPVTRLGRAAHSLAGDESGEAAQRLLSRQETQPGRVHNIIQRSVAGGDFEATRTTGLQNLRQEADQAYQGFYAEPDLLSRELGDLFEDPIFRQATSQAMQQARVAAIRRNEEAVRSGRVASGAAQLEPVPFSPRNDPQRQALLGELNDARDALVMARRRRQDATTREERRAALDESRDLEDQITAINRQIKEIDEELPEVFSPEMLDLIQRQLRLKSEGALSDPNAAAHARDLREVFLSRIEDHYANFRDIRRNYATGMGEFGEEGALQAGSELVARLGAPAREALRGFAEMTPAQQELFRLGFARKLMDDAANVQIGGAVANKFNTTAVREIVETLYPRSNPQLWEQGQRLLRDLQREALTTRTAREVLSGSRTAELASDMGHLMEGAQAAADVATGRWGNLLQNLSTRLSTQMGQRGAAQMLRMLTETDPAALLPILNRLEQAAQASAQRNALVAQARNLRADVLPALGGQTGILTGRELGAVKPGD